MRRPQAFIRPRSYRPLNRGLSDFLKLNTARFGGSRCPPYLEWGPVWHFTSTAYPVMAGGKFGDGRMVIVGVATKSADSGDAAADSYVVSADGLTPTPIVSTFPNAGTNGSGGPVSTLLGDGRLLFIGGGVGNVAQTIDPGTLTWVSQPGLPTDLNNGWCLVTLQNGNALRIGGAILGSPDNSCQEYIQGSNTWVTRGNLNSGHSNFNATVMADGKVLVSGGSGPEIYDPTTHLWTLPVGSPSIDNPNLEAFTTSGGRTFLGGVDFSFLIHLDEYIPATGMFVPRASLAGSLSGSSGAGAQFFETGDNYIALLDLGSWPNRLAFYDLLNDVWTEQGANYPEAMGKGSGALLQITKTTFLWTGGGEGIGSGFAPYTLPHDPSRYALISTVRRQTPVRPTFAGLVSVEQGTDPSKVVLHWAPASHPTTYVGDMAYFVAVGFSAGDAVTNADNHNWYQNSQGWAGVDNIELFGLPTDTDCYFVVRARKMTFIETSPGENDGLSSGNALDFDTNTAELLFHTALTISAPTFSWSSAPSLAQPRTGLYAAKLATNHPSSLGDVRRLMVLFGRTGGGGMGTIGDIYDPSGTSMLESVRAQPDSLFDAVVIEASPFLDDGSECRKLTVIGGDAFNGNLRASCLRYYQYNRAWAPNDGVHPSFPDMNEAVSRHAAVGLPTPNVHDVLRFGGILNSGDDTSATDSVERLFHRFLQRVFYTAGVSDFTIGAVLTGSSTGTQGNIIAFGDSNTTTDGVLFVDTSPYGGGFYTSTEEITDTDGGDAFTAIFSQSVIYENWDFQVSMIHKRQYHQAILLDDGRVLVAGGHDEASRKIHTIEIFTPSTNTWTAVFGLSLNYIVNTNPFTAGNWVAGDVSGAGGAFARIGQDNNSGATGTLLLSSWSQVDFSSGENLFDTNLGFNTGGSFSVGATVIGGSSGATGTIVAVINFPGNNGVLVLSGVVGTFSTGESLTDGFSGNGTANGPQTGSGTAQANGGITELIRAHDNFCMVKLLDGRVLLISGGGSPFTDGPVDLFDPSGPDTVAPVADLPEDRKFFTAHVFGDGSVGVFGGIDTNTGLSTTDVRVYDPVGDAWSHPSGADMTTARSGHASFLLANNTILVVGGTDDSGTILDSAEISG